MSKKERQPLAPITENKELNLVNKDVTDGRRRNKKQNSVRSADLPSSPLIRAIRRGSSSTSLFFQELTNLNNLDIKETDTFQRNAFHYAVSKPDILKKILKKFQSETKSSVLEALHQADKEGETPMHRAAIIANIQSLEILHEYDNSLINLKTTTRKRSVLHLAVKSRSVVAVKFVLSKAPDLMNSVDYMLQTPAHYAASLTQSNVMELLISKGSGTTELDAHDQLPIHIAATKGLRNNVLLLLQEGPDTVDDLDSSGQSPLLLAAKNSFPNVVSYLLAKDASHDLKDKFGLTAFDWAVKNTSPEVVQIFLDTTSWKEIVSTSRHGAEGSLAVMTESMPEMAKMLLDKCVTTKGTKEHPDYQVIYDFVCLESRDEDGSWCPRFEALDTMVENVSEICLRHPVAVKYVDVKWRKRGFKYTLASILLVLIFHICLMIYTTRVIGVVKMHRRIRQHRGIHGNESVNETEHVHERHGRPPNAAEMMGLRVIILTVLFAGILREVVEMIVQQKHYFTTREHYYRLALCITTMSYLLPVNQKITVRQIGMGAVTVMLSWLNLMQFLKIVPVFGIYIILVQKVFWTLMKVFIVVLIYLLSFATTFYILLAEHDSFRNIYISFVTTFVAMMSGIEYDSLFVESGIFPQIYELKMVVLVLFMLVMTIVVNNSLIGLAVGDANEVMKSARFDKFLQRAHFVIRLERSLNNIPYMKCTEDVYLVEFPGKKKTLYQKISDLFYFGSELDAVDGGSEADEHDSELEITLEDHIEKAVEIKLENFRSSLQHDLKGIQDQLTDDRKDLEEKIDMILQKLK